MRIIKKEIRISNLNFGNVLPFNKELRDKLEKKYKIVIDNTNPQYICVNDKFYTDNNLSRRFFDLNKNAISIFLSGEAISPDFNLFDYALGYDRYLNHGDRFERYIFAWDNTGIQSLLEERKRDTVFELLETKKKFCNFIYSNDKGHKNRELIFKRISEYKHVDSLGKFLNNSGTIIDVNMSSNNWYINSVELKKPYKFSIAAENASFAGYVSEKILSSFQAYSIPIYWGDEYIGEDININAFINLHKYRSLDDALEYIKKIDEDDNLWVDIVCQPILTQSSLKKHVGDNKDRRVFEFFDNIFEQPIDKAYRKPFGYWTSIYSMNLGNDEELNRISLSNTIMSRITQLALEDDNSIKRWLDKKSIRNVALYGMGKIGKLFFDLLEKKGVVVSYCFDQNGGQYKDITIHREILKDMIIEDVIICTTYGRENIYQNLTGSCDRIWMIEELFEQLI